MKFEIMTNKRNTNKCSTNCLGNRGIVACVGNMKKKLNSNYIDFGHLVLIRNFKYFSDVSVNKDNKEIGG